MIEFKKVTKKYLLQSSKINFALKNTLAHIGAVKRGDIENSYFTALDNVSFRLENGDKLGVIGDNGSGKTTLLRMCAGVSLPTSGEVLTDMRPHILETSFGLQENLTARENIYILGYLQGMTQKYLDSIIDDVINFADLGVYIDQPMKYFSSGMHGRIALSLARFTAHELLLMDEIYSRGDVHFKEKGVEVFENWMKGDKTVIYISHDLQSIKDFCSKCLHLEKGKIVAFGSAEEVVNQYLEGRK